MSVDWGYSASMFSTFHEEMYRDQGDAEVVTHTFTQVCDCEVNVTLWNDINSLTELRIVVVQDPIQDVVMSVSTPLAVEQGNTVTEATITFTKQSTGTPVPTSPQYLIYSGNAGNDTLNNSLTGLNADGDSVDVNFDYEIGHPCVVANLSNLVDFVVYSGASYCIDVYQRIVNPQLVASPLLGTSYETVITATMTMDWGTEYDVLWDWKDGATETQSYNLYSDSMVKTRVYTQPGSYLIAVTPTNPITPSGTAVPIAQVVVIEHKIIPANTTLNGEGISEIGIGDNYEEAYELSIILEPGI